MNNESMNMISKALLLAALIIIVYLFYMGNELVPQLKSLGLVQYIEQQGALGGLMFLSFTFAFPLALHFIVLAGLMSQKGNRNFAFALSIVIAVAASSVVYWPFIVGRENSWVYFAIGGGILMVMISFVAWFWVKQRLAVEPSLRKSIDFKGAAYFFFALATWNSCGAMGMPGYALYPERSISVDAYPFIIGQVKAIMLYFVLAWICLFVSYWLQRKRDH